MCHPSPANAIKMPIQPGRPAYPLERKEASVLPQCFQPKQNPTRSRHSFDPRAQRVLHDFSENGSRPPDKTT